jgi:hypothetical protein
MHFLAKNILKAIPTTLSNKSERGSNCIFKMFFLL